jgi:hypothetical protein
MKFQGMLLPVRPHGPMISSSYEASYWIDVGCFCGQIDGVFSVDRKIV